MTAIEFLREKGILDNDKTQFIIKYPDNTTVDVVDLLNEYNKGRFQEYIYLLQSKKQTAIANAGLWEDAIKHKGYIGMSLAFSVAIEEVLSIVNPNKWDGKMFTEDELMLKEYNPFIKAHLAELDNLLCEVSGIFDGWHSDGTYWTEYDESIRKKIDEFRNRYTYEAPVKK